MSLPRKPSGQLQLVPINVQTRENDESKGKRKAERKLPAQCRMFNPSSTRYRCCLGSSHISTGALAVGCVELIFLTLIAIIAVGDYIFYSIPFWSFLLMLIITGVRLPAVALMLSTVYHRYSASALLLPELLCQVVSVLTAIGYIAYIGVRYRRFAYAETKDEAEMQETVIQSSISATYLTLATMLFLVQIWFLHVVYRCYKFLHDKRMHETYWSKPIYV